MSGNKQKLRIRTSAHCHTTDIDTHKKLDAKVWDGLANVCVLRATSALQTSAGNYTELQRHHIADIFNSMNATRRTIRRVLEPAGEVEPESVDALALARLQLEGLYSICLMLEDPKYVDCYLQDHWKKRYLTYLLAREEMKDLPRGIESEQTLEPMIALLKLREIFGVTSSQQFTIDQDELGTPMPSAFGRETIPKFPMPSGIIHLMQPGSDKRRMLERLHFDYVELCSYVHGLPQANLLKIMFDKRSPYQRYATDSQIAERFQRDVVGPSFLWSSFSIAQAAAELTERYPGDIPLAEAAYNAWAELSAASMPTKAIWEIRTRKLLGVLYS